eukprot:4425506-Amphidinium_carterae.1
MQRLMHLMSNMVSWRRRIHAKGFSSSAGAWWASAHRLSLSSQGHRLVTLDGASGLGAVCLRRVGDSEMATEIRSELQKIQDSPYHQNMMHR